MMSFLKKNKYRNAEMVKYWKTQESVEAKVTRAPEGHEEMYMEGEKYPFAGHPRGVLLYGGFSKLKHEIKNQVFNHIWARLDNGDSVADMISELKTQTLPEIFEIAEKSKYDMLPPEQLSPPVKEIWRALTKVENGSLNARKLKEILCFILQEDDAYRYRLQWVAKFFPRWWKPTLQHFDIGLKMLEHAEIVGDMKERQRLLRRVLTTILQDPAIRSYFDAFLKEVDWTKVRLTDADKYFFRAKWFKVDYPEYGY